MINIGNRTIVQNEKVVGVFKANGTKEELNLSIFISKDIDENKLKKEFDVFIEDIRKELFYKSGGFSNDKDFEKNIY